MDLLKEQEFSVLLLIYFEGTISKNVFWFKPESLQLRLEF